MPDMSLPDPSKSISQFQGHTKGCLHTLHCTAAAFSLCTLGTRIQAGMWLVGSFPAYSWHRGALMRLGFHTFTVTPLPTYLLFSISPFSCVLHPTEKVTRFSLSLSQSYCSACAVHGQSCKLAESGLGPLCTLLLNNSFLYVCLQKQTTSSFCFLTKALW